MVATAGVAGLRSCGRIWRDCACAVHVCSCQAHALCEELHGHRELVSGGGLLAVCVLASRRPASVVCVCFCGQRPHSFVCEARSVGQRWSPPLCFGLVRVWGGSGGVYLSACGWCVVGMAARWCLPAYRALGRCLAAATVIFRRVVGPWVLLSRCTARCRSHNHVMGDGRA